MFIENILGSRTKVKILRVLTEVRTAYALKDLSKEIGLSPSITHQAAEELAEERVLIKIKGTKKERLYRFNAESAFTSALFDLFKIEKTRQRKSVIFLNIWNILENTITKNEKKIDMAILFGSQARGEATLRSDIDLLIISKGKQPTLIEKIKKIDKRINLLLMTLAEFQSHQKHKTPLYDNIKRDGVILYLHKKKREDLKEFLEDIRGDGR